MSASIPRQPLPPGQRIDALDFMRGLFILLACLQHFAGYVNHWYPPGHAHAAGNAIDDVLHALIWTLTPAGDHLFLFLAAFNLANRTREDFRPVYRRKLRFYGILFIFFLFEPFFVEPDLGDVLTFGPLLAWMIILAALATLHTLWGWRGVAIAMLLHLPFLGMPMEGLAASLEASVRESTGLVAWRYESRLDLFFGSGATGFLLGYFYHHGPGERATRLTRAFALGTALFVPWAIFGTGWTVDRLDIWSHEYDLANTSLGLLSIWASNLMFASACLLFEHTVRPLRFPVVTWCGVYSLLVFAMHRALFARVLVPLRDYADHRFGLPVHNSWPEIAVFIALTLAAAWWVRRSRLLPILDR